MKNHVAVLQIERKRSRKKMTKKEEEKEGQE